MVGGGGFFGDTPLNEEQIEYLKNMQFEFPGERIISFSETAKKGISEAALEDVDHKCYSNNLENFATLMQKYPEGTVIPLKFPYLYSGLGALFIGHSETSNERVKMLKKKPKEEL
jgi:hypothetical protein